MSDSHLNNTVVGEDVVDDCGYAVVLPFQGLSEILHLILRSVSWWRYLNDNQFYERCCSCGCSSSSLQRVVVVLKNLVVVIVSITVVVTICSYLLVRIHVTYYLCYVWKYLVSITCIKHWFVSIEIVFFIFYL